MEEFDNSEMDWINEINPNEGEIWLHQNFNNLRPIVKDDKTFYVNEENEPIFYFYQNEKNGVCWFKSFDFWTVLRDDFDLKLEEIQGILRKWLDVTYNLRELTPIFAKSIPFP